MSKDLVITAAHCLNGSPVGMRFAPGYLDGFAPKGTWTVKAAYADQRWIRSQDPHFDYAFLRIAPNSDGDLLQDVVGGFHLRVPTAPEPVEAVGYGAGQDDEPITCAGYTRPYGASSQHGYLEFDCAGFVDGTSGSPFLAAGGNGAGAIVGIIGGPHAGGCTDAISYSSAFDETAFSLLARATAGGASDVLPAAHDDC